MEATGRNRIFSNQKIPVIIDLPPETIDVANNFWYLSWNLSILEAKLNFNISLIIHKGAISIDNFYRILNNNNNNNNNNDNNNNNNNNGLFTVYPLQNGSSPVKLSTLKYITIYLSENYEFKKNVNPITLRYSFIQWQKDL